jgi:ribosomal protein S18 acetylase RimI-like enzyme
VGRITAIKVRQAVPDDLSLIVHHYGPGDSPCDPFGDLTRLQAIPLDGLIVVEVDGQYAGFLYWFVGENPWFDPAVETYAHIVEMQVVEGYRGIGVGKKMLVHALEQLKQHAVEAVYIDTREDNEVARRLYESMGFRPFSCTIHYKLETAS